VREILPKTETVVEAEHLSFVYRETEIEAIEDMSFRLAPAQFSAIMGPNGSGKSTLLRLMIGLLQPTQGSIRLMGEDPARSPDVVQRLVGYVPQYESINMRLPVRNRDIVGLGVASRTNRRLGASEVQDRAQAALEAVGMASMSDRRYSSLSGGQRQRVLIARALAVDPHVLVLDEPFAAMDLANQRRIAESMQRLVREKGISVITVVHNVNTLVHFIDRVILINRILIAEGHPDEVLRREPLQQAYGATVPIIVCEEGFPHPIMEDSHG